MEVGRAWASYMHGGVLRNRTRRTMTPESEAVVQAQGAETKK